MGNGDAPARRDWRNARGPSELNLTKSDPDLTRSAPLPSRGRRIPVRYAKAAAPLERPKRRAKREGRREQREETREDENKNIYEKRKKEERREGLEKLGKIRKTTPGGSKMRP